MKAIKSLVTKSIFTYLKPAALFTAGVFFLGACTAEENGTQQVEGFGQQERGSQADVQNSQSQARGQQTAPNNNTASQNNPQQTDNQEAATAQSNTQNQTTQGDQVEGTQVSEEQLEGYEELRRQDYEDEHREDVAPAE